VPCAVLLCIEFIWLHGCAVHESGIVHGVHRAIDQVVAAVVVAVVVGVGVALTNHAPFVLWSVVGFLDALVAWIFEVVAGCKVRANRSQCRSRRRLFRWHLWACRFVVDQNRLAGCVGTCDWR
jgi:steroid 5-alpha reductase family enzyme